MNKIYIQETENFAERAMARIYEMVRRRQLMREAMLVLVAAVPLVVRSVWLFVRSDYFSVARLPMGALIVRGYQMFLSPLAVYAFGGIVLTLFAAYIFRNGRSLTSLRIVR